MFAKVRLKGYTPYTYKKVYNFSNVSTLTYIEKIIKTYLN
jgi:hypothetical protein